MVITTRYIIISSVGVFGSQELTIAQVPGRSEATRNGGGGIVKIDNQGRTAGALTHGKAGRRRLGFRRKHRQQQNKAGYIMLRSKQVLNFQGKQLVSKG